MGSLCNDMEVKVLDHLLGNTALAIAADDMYLALGTGTADESGIQTEVGGGIGYAREQLTNANWDIAGSTTARTTNYGALVTFGQATASWGTISEWAIFDDLSAGNPIAYGQITTPRLVNINDIPSIAIDELQVEWVTSAVVGDANVGWSDFISEEMLDHIFKDAEYTQPTPYVGFATGLTTDTSGITGEAAAIGGYARVDSSALFAAAASGDPSTCANGGAITFTVSGDWTAALDNIFIANSSGGVTAADVMFFGTVTSFSALDGDTVEISIGDLVVTLE